MTVRLRMIGFIAIALAMGYGIPHLNERHLSALTAPVGKDQVIAFLSAMSSGMMAFTGIIFSLLFVVLQFGTTAYTPRIVEILGRNRILYDAGGVFTGTFVYSLMALRGVGSLGADQTGALTLWIAFVWLLASIVALVRLFHSLDDLTHTNVLFMLGDSAQCEIERLYPQPLPSTAESPDPDRLALGPVEQQVRYQGRPRYILSLDVARLVATAARHDAVLRIPFALGDSITDGSPLVFIHRARAPLDEKPLREAIRVGKDRELECNPKYAMRLLVDIAVRALSSAMLDPTTTVQTLDQIEAVLASLGAVNLDVGNVRDGSGVLRLIYDATTWEEYLELALAEIQQYGADSIQVERRIAALLAFLRGRLPPPRRLAIERLAERQRMTIDETFASPRLRERARLEDRQGLGHVSADGRSML